MPNFSIEFNFAFEDIGLDQATRDLYENALRMAADAWADYIEDDFDPVRPGTNFQIVNPSNPSINASYTISEHIDDVLIFVGWDDLGDFEIVGASQRITGGRAYSGATQFFGDSLSSRIISDYKGQPNTDYEPWTGSITFNSRLLPGNSLGNALGTEFSFGSDAESDKVHFVSTAVHEIGHILGIGASPAFEARIFNDVFTGMNAMEVSEDGLGIPLDPDEAHVADGYANNTVAMDPVDSIGTAKNPGLIDFALLADIGYHIKDFEGQSYDRQGERRDLVSDNGETVSGTTARDILFGEGGNDTIFGNDGDDVLSGDAGDDWMIGGEGADVFEYGFFSGADGIQDFDLGEDLLRISSRYGLTPAEIADLAVELNTVGDIGIYRIDFGLGNVFSVQYDKTVNLELNANHVVVANTDRGGFGSPIWQSDLDAALHDDDVSWREQSVYWTSYGGSPFPTHAGIDIPAPSGTPIRAVADGTVYRAFYNLTSELGNVVLIDHGDDEYSLYAHLSEFGPGLFDGFRPNDGFDVKRGEVIGYVGSTGFPLGGDHLHFSYLDMKQESAQGFSLDQTNGSLGIAERDGATFIWSTVAGYENDRTGQWEDVLEVAGRTIFEIADQPPHVSGGSTDGTGTETWDRGNPISQTVIFDGIIDREGEEYDAFAIEAQEGRLYRVTVIGAPIRDYHALSDPSVEIYLDGGGEIVESQNAPTQIGRVETITFRAQSMEPHYVYVEKGVSLDGRSTGGYTVYLEDITTTNILLPALEPEDFDVAGTTASTIVGRPDELNGDRFFNFWNRDTFIVQETVNPENYRIREGSALIDLDMDGDGVYEVTWTLEGDYSGGDFFLIQGSGTTTIAFAAVTLGDSDDNIRIGNEGRDRIYGRDGDDTLRGLDGEDTLEGEGGDDRLEGGGANDHLDGGDDNDELFGGGSGDDTLIGGRGSDFLRGENGNDYLDGGDGFDFLNGGTDDDTMLGGNGNDRIFANLGDDSLFGGPGDDTLYGGPSGNDVLYGDAGADLLFGEAGKDFIEGEAGDDTLFGGGNDDTLLGGDDDDNLSGGLGNDSLFGGLTGDDTLMGNQGSDYLFAEDGDDLVDGGDGFDLMNGGAGNDTMLGGNGNDRLEGNLGEDVLDGGSGDDELFGGNGTFADTLIGGTGNDTLSGEQGADTFVFEDGFGTDVITDFDEYSGAEKVDLTLVSGITDFADLQAFHLSQSGANALITDGANTITLLNVTVVDLGADDFEFLA